MSFSYSMFSLFVFFNVTTSHVYISLARSFPQLFLYCFVCKTVVISISLLIYLEYRRRERITNGNEETENSTVIDHKKISTFV